MPVPLTEIVLALVAFDEIEMVAVLLPAEEGEKTTLIVQLCPAEIDPTHVPSTRKSLLDEEKPLIARLEFPVFVRVTYCLELLEPTGVDAKVSNDASME